MKKKKLKNLGEVSGGLSLKINSNLSADSLHIEDRTKYVEHEEMTYEHIEKTKKKTIDIL